jgi:diamine N-acetyltransferase
VTLVLAPVTADRLDAAMALRLRPGQETFVEPVSESLAEAYVHGDVAWPRLVLDEAAGGEVVGFVMGFLDIEWDPEERPGLRRSGIWRLNVAAQHQGRGVGRFAVEGVCAEIRRRGTTDAAHVTWKPGAGGPEAFWLGLGFARLDELADEERVGRRPL